jgi:hypothetical protein
VEPRNLRALLLRFYLPMTRRKLRNAMAALRSMVPTLVPFHCTARLGTLKALTRDSQRKTLIQTQTRRL